MGLGVRLAKALVCKVSAFRPQDHGFNSPVLQGFERLCETSFLPQLTQLCLLPRSLNEYQRLLGANLRWISVPSRRVKDSHLLNTTENWGKPRSMGQLARKGFN